MFSVRRTFDPTGTPHRSGARAGPRTSGNGYAGNVVDARRRYAGASESDDFWTNSSNFWTILLRVSPENAQIWHFIGIPSTFFPFQSFQGPSNVEDYDYSKLDDLVEFKKEPGVLEEGNLLKYVEKSGFFEISTN